MPADTNGTSANGNGNGGSVAMLPVLNPVLVARGDEVDKVIGPARASIAALSLQLRVALRDAAAAEVTTRVVPRGLVALSLVLLVDMAAMARRRLARRRRRGQFISPVGGSCRG